MVHRDGLSLFIEMHDWIRGVKLWKGIRAMGKYTRHTHTNNRHTHTHIYLYCSYFCALWVVDWSSSRRKIKWVLIIKGILVIFVTFQSGVWSVSDITQHKWEPDWISPSSTNSSSSPTVPETEIPLLSSPWTFSSPPTEVREARTSAREGSEWIQHHFNWYSLKITMASCKHCGVWCCSVRWRTTCGWPGCTRRFKAVVEKEAAAARLQLLFHSNTLVSKLLPQRSHFVALTFVNQHSQIQL